MHTHEARGFISTDEIRSSYPSDMVRFYWRADVQKKAKIMRKVKFPMELDVSELASPKRRVTELLSEEKS